MIKIAKKQSADALLSNFEELLDTKTISNKYPARNIEPWRKFDPDYILGPLTAAATKGIHIAAPEYKGNELSIKKISEWAKTNEILVEKVKKLINEIPAEADRSYFEQVVSNKIKFSEMYILYIPAQFSAKEVIQIEWNTKSDQLNLYNLVIMAENDSRATITMSLNQTAADIGAIYTLAQPNSSLHLHALLANDKKTKQPVTLFSFKSMLKDHATSLQGIYNSGMNRAKIFSDQILYKGASTENYGIFSGSHALSDHDYHIVHKESRSTSQLNFKMAVMENSHGIFTGQTEILPGTAACEAQQNNKNWILDRSSKIDAIPKLNILAEDVSASHGSATGEISDDEIFYLTSRGLDEASAKKLLLYGFFEDMLSKAFQKEKAESAFAFKQKVWSHIIEKLDIQTDDE